MSTQGTNAGVQFVNVEESQAGQRIDNFLLARLKGVPKSRIYRIVRKGEVRVNKKRVKPEYKLQANDIVRVPPVRVASAKEVSVPSEQLQDLIKASILYQDESLLVINKPSGLPVHAGTGVKIGLIEVLRYMYPEEPALELVHRLDKGTSGCIMVAKNTSTLRTLNQALKLRQVSKVYHALVIGDWPSTIKEVDAPLYKHQPRSGERRVEVSEEGKSALTYFRPLQHFSGFSLIEARPVTGRTHQIRVHAQSVGHSISGDDKYSSDENNLILRRRGVGRLCLHAAELSLEHPLTGKPFKVFAPYDDDFSTAINFLSKSGIE